MRQKFTYDLIQEMIEKSKETLYLSGRSDHEKDILNSITPYVHINKRLQAVVGRAFLAHTKHVFTKKHAIREKIDPIMVQGRKSFFIMELNMCNQNLPKYEVYDTVSHELAHLLDFYLVGFYNRSKQYHHNGWRDLHIAMGGSGRIHGQPKGNTNHGKDKSSGPARSKKNN